MPSLESPGCSGSQVSRRACCAARLLFAAGSTARLLLATAPRSRDGTLARNGVIAGRIAAYEAA
eukprot:11969825-Alexandrium_andersonii.AAC.1